MESSLTSKKSMCLDVNTKVCCGVGSGAHLIVPASVVWSAGLKVGLGLRCQVLAETESGERCRHRWSVRLLVRSPVQKRP